MKKNLNEYFSLIKDTSFYCDGGAIKTWDEKDYDTAITYVRNESIEISNYGNMQFPYYCFTKITEYKKHGKICSENSYILSHFALKKDTIEKYKLTEVDDYLDENHLWSIYNMLDKLNIPYISVRIKGDGVLKHYTNIDKLKALAEAVNIKQQSLVIEGTDWPYWFNFEGELIPSTTSNWFKYLQTTFNYISPASLVPYTGEDMYNKHLFDKN